MPDVMKRWVMNDFGRPNLHIEEAPIPQPKPGEVLVKTAAVSLNYRDRMVIENGMGRALDFPFTPASDMAGEIVALGDGVTRFRTGQHVISAFSPDWIDGQPRGAARELPYRTLGGTYQGVLSSHLALPAEGLSLKPETLDDAEASTLPVAGLTAWSALAEHAAVKAGDWVLVHGTGGVSLFACQIARARGARVIAVTSSADKVARVKALGADIAIDRTETDWADAVIAATGGYGVDHVIEVVGGDNVGRSVDVAAIGGQVSLIGVMEGFAFSGPTAALMLKQVRVQGISVGHRSALERFVRFVDENRIRPVIDKSYAFEDLPLALDHLDRGAFGKIVLTM